MTRTGARLAAISLLALAVTGCQDPYTSDRARQGQPTTTPRVTTPGDVDRPGPTAGPIPVTAQRWAPSVRGAATAFAIRWINWDWRCAAAQQRALARLAVGELARQLRASAATTRLDSSLARDKPGSRGTVAATELTTRDEQAAGIVVTREQSYTAGSADLGGQHYRVYRAQLIHDRKGWGVSGWEPQP